MTLIIDGDSETQDLSRFLQARPYVNENLQLLLEGQKPLSKEFVEQCYVKVWQDNPHLFCMPAMPNHDAIFHAPSKVLRQFLLVFETLDQIFDTIIVDMGSMAGMFQRALYRSADGVVFVLNDDPASLYGSVERLSVIREVLQPDANVKVVDNAPRGGLSRRVLIREFSRAAQLNNEQWSSSSLHFSKQGMRWPGSGATLVSLGNKAQSRSCELLAGDLGIIETISEESAFERLFRTFRRFLYTLRKSKKTKKLEARPATEVLPKTTKRPELPAAPEWISKANTESLTGGNAASGPTHSAQGAYGNGTGSSKEEKAGGDLEGIVTPASTPTW